MPRVSLSDSFMKPFKACSDVTGLEVGADLSEGVPAVRLRKSKGQVEMVAAGFLDLPGALPMLSGASEAQTWRLPAPFRAPHAALAIRSPHASLRHTAGGHGETADRAGSLRSVSRQTAPETPPLVASLPEFQAAWAARLLPEGHRPTACSLQVSAAAAINTFTASPLFQTLPDTTLILFAFAGYTSLVAFHGAKLVLYREHPVGYGHIRTAISNEMRIGTELADSVLQDTFIDPIPMIEPVLKPLFRQVEISSDYLLRRRNCQVQQFFLCGLPSGAKYWASIFSRAIPQPLKTFHPFDGLLKAPRADPLPADIPAVEPYLMTALGAARAALEDV